VVRISPTNETTKRIRIITTRVEEERRISETPDPGSFEEESEDFLLPSECKL
jgi:hypothetical protein